jgi:hypothetical protein
MGMPMNLEEVWEYREETVFPQLFGTISRGIFLLSQDTFKPFLNAKIDPRWLTHGVFEFAPTEERQSWLFITSGYSNPWHTLPEDYDETAFSGAGVEFSIESNESSDWPILFLQRMLAYDMMLTSGHFGDKPALQLHDRIPIKSPIDGKEGTQVTNAILHEPVHYPRSFKLPSGNVEILQFLGVTDNERDFAQEAGFTTLRDRMAREGNFPVTNTVRR